MTDRRPKGIAILGSTGSIGVNTLDVVRKNPGRFKAVALSAGNNIDILKRQIEEFRPLFVSVAGPEAAKALKASMKVDFILATGVHGAVEAACFEGVEMVLSAISGAAGLVPTVAAIRAGRDIALANKETLVAAGPIVMEEAASKGVRLLPVDSEHSAVFQSLSGHRKEDVKRLILTASGGPFLDLPLERLDSVTPREALRHPKWSMGKKITVDSATLMNKGLEVIEASFLFGLPAGKISVAVHPQSIVHSMVEYIDGSIVSQMSSPDMRGPIAYALSYPERIECGVRALDLAGLTLEFREPQEKRFPCLGLAYEALKAGGSAPAALNAADEVAVEMFLNGRLPFTGIYRVIASVMERHEAKSMATVEDVLAADGWARRQAGEFAVKCAH